MSHFYMFLAFTKGVEYHMGRVAIHEARTGAGLGPEGHQFLHQLRETAVDLHDSTLGRGLRSRPHQGDRAGVRDSIAQHMPRQEGPDWVSLRKCAHAEDGPLSHLLKVSVPGHETSNGLNSPSGGGPECTGDPESSLPLHRVEQFEDGLVTGALVEPAPIAISGNGHDNCVESSRCGNAQGTRVPSLSLVGSEGDEL